MDMNFDINKLENEGWIYYKDKIPECIKDDDRSEIVECVGKQGTKEIFKAWYCYYYHRWFLEDSIGTEDDHNCPDIYYWKPIVTFRDKTKAIYGR